MAGILSYFAYVPIYRLSGDILNQVWGNRASGEKAVANVDEDSLTMGVEAARGCLPHLRKAVSGLFKTHNLAAGELGVYGKEVK